jgi:hypothetical protein
VCLEQKSERKPTAEEARRSADAVKRLLASRKAPSGGATQPMSAPTTDLNCVYLAFNDLGYASQEYAGNRFDSCRMEHWTVTYYVDGAPQGFMQFDLFLSQVLSPTATSWSVQLMGLYKSKGGLVWGIAIGDLVMQSLGTGCSTGFGGQVPITLNPNAGWNDDSQYWGPSCSVPSGGISQAGSLGINFRIYVNGDIPTPLYSIKMSTYQQIRCDNVRGNIGAGCALPKVGGIIEFDRASSTHGQAATGYLNWQVAFPDHAGYLGYYGFGAALTYTSDATRVNANRQVACGNFVPQNGGTCDEYPFASTLDGAAAPNSVYGRDYGVTEVSSSQNSSAGSVLAAGYRVQHILDGDGFWAKIL